MAYIPVHTLHEMLVETGQIGQAPVIICSGCEHPIPAPRGAAMIQCRDCGRKMQVKSIHPATQATRVNP